MDTYAHCHNNSLEYAIWYTIDALRGKRRDGEPKILKPLWMMSTADTIETKIVCLLVAVIGEQNERGVTIRIEDVVEDLRLSQPIKEALLWLQNPDEDHPNSIGIEVLAIETAYV